MPISKVEILDRAIEGAQNIDEGILWWKQKQWDNIRTSIVINPFDPDVNLGVCNYDLSVGPEYVSLRDPYNVLRIEGADALTVKPGDTVLILTEEYVCLPLDLMGMIVPRARWLFEGVSLHATRIDPSWHGRLLIGFTNVQRHNIALSRGEPFCTMYFEKISPPLLEGLTRRDLRSIGRESIGRIRFEHARLEEMVLPDAVTATDIDLVVQQFGKPWDIMRGALQRSKEEVKEFIVRDIGPDIVDQAASRAYERAFTTQQRLLGALIITLIGAVVTTIVKVLFF